MKLGDLCNGAGIFCPIEYQNLEIGGISSDSRERTENGLFVCLRGGKNDGHAHIGEAIQNGAIAVLTDADAAVDPGAGIIRLQSRNPRASLAYLFDAWYGYPSRRLAIIGVTGTNGKTSVSHMLRTVLENSLCTCGVIGTVGSESRGGTYTHATEQGVANLTTPDPKDLYRILAQMADDGVEYVVMEASSHALELEKLAPIRFRAAIFTNLTPEHLDFHKTMEAYAQAKAKLFSKSALSVLCADSPYCNQMLAAATGKHVTCGVSQDADYQATDVELDGQDGVLYRLSSGRTRLRLSCPIAGEFTVMNSMLAAVCALELGCSPAAVKTALATMGGVKGRMERVKLGIGAEFAVIIDYAHTPDALEKLLLTARRLLQREGRLVLLFGCGGDRDRTKRAVMGRIASELADLVIITSDNCRGEDPMNIIREILSGIANREAVRVIPDRAEAIRYAVQQGKRGDLILLAGKGHEEYEIVGEERRPFHERILVKEAFEARLRAPEGMGLTEGEQTNEGRDTK